MFIISWTNLKPASLEWSPLESKLNLIENRLNFLVLECEGFTAYIKFNLVAHIDVDFLKNSRVQS